ncbi:ornithine cyclodeaminase [Aerococcaceae bacterium DSM 111021]|nr:ornithine cyclodeaminase [Aerococcaceae bacterium DSM 111021]
MTKQGQIDFLYLNEQDMIDAGVLDMQSCVNVMEDVFQILGTGDYRMGGRDSNSHGMVVAFPDEPEHNTMPSNGPDRRFCAMPAYLGGEYRVAGCKWYGSNIDNKDKNLPRSILTMNLNDADTGAPLAFMSANLLSAWRTGAIPGVGVRYLAKPDSKVVGVLGAGAIGSSTAEALLLEAKQAELFKIYDIDPKQSDILKQELETKFPKVRISIVDSIEEAVRETDILNLATSGEANPKIESEWIKPGALIIGSSSGQFDPNFVIENVRLVVDNWKMYEEVKYEDVYPYNTLEMGVLGRLFLDWIQEERMTDDIIMNVGDIINGKIPARENDDDIIIFALGGQPLYDIAWGYTIYQNALKKDIGTKLNLWETAYQAR